MNNHLEIGDGVYAVRDLAALHMARNEYMNKQHVTILTDKSLSEKSEFPAVVHYFPYSGMEPNKVWEKVTSLGPVIDWLAETPRHSLSGTHVD